MRKRLLTYLFITIAILALVSYMTKTNESFYGMSPGTLDQLASTHVQSGLPGMNRRF